MLKLVYFVGGCIRLILQRMQEGLEDLESWRQGYDGKIIQRLSKTLFGFYNRCTGRLGHKHE